jgi:hypothetical protein
VGKKPLKLQFRRYGRLSVESEFVSGKGYFCVCDCGNSRWVVREHLEKGRVKSCGCLNKERFTMAGMSGTPTASSYIAMLQRTGNGAFDVTQNDKYACYTEKGITVCDRWLGTEGFFNFLSDMGERPTDTTLERMDNSIGYSPENCKWETRSNQCYNRDKFSNNTTGRTGVYQRKENGKWRAKITVLKKTVDLGTFDTYEEAVAAREQAELHYYGFNKD